MTSNLSTRGGGVGGGSRFDRLVDNLFDDADQDRSGFVDLAETYELILKIYLQINRQSPINPPPREDVIRLFRAADKDRNKKISREEFQSLAKNIGQRALVRIVAHKSLTLLAAPLLAEWVLRKTWNVQSIPSIAKKYFPSKAVPIVTSAAFCRSVLMVSFMATLGGLVMKTVNSLLDMQLPQAEALKNEN